MTLTTETRRVRAAQRRAARAAKRADRAGRPADARAAIVRAAASFDLWESALASAIIADREREGDAR